MTTVPTTLSSISASQTISSWKRWRFPLLVLMLGGLFFSVPLIWNALDLEASMPIFMLIYLAPLLTTIILGVWWTFFSGYRWSVRLGVASVIFLSLVGFYFIVRDWEFTTTRAGMLVPRWQFVWEPAAEEKVAQYQDTHPVQEQNLSPMLGQIGLQDFPSYRGAQRDGLVRFAKLDTDWKTQPPQVIWRHPCTWSYSGVAVAGNLVVTLEQRGAHESIVCYDRHSGQQRWIYSYDVFYKDRMGNGPRSTPTIHNGLIFTVGATGEFVCLTVEGKKQWSINILSEAKAKNIKWGLTGSPLIFEDLVIVHAGIDPEAPAGAALLAYEQATGKKRWQAGNRMAGYSSPQLALLGGKPQVLLFDAGGLISFDAKTGRELWEFPWVTIYDMNMIQPLVLADNRVFLSSEKENGCAMLRVAPQANESAPWKVEALWHNKNLFARFANPVTDGKYIYGLHNLRGLLTCMDAQNGELRWRGERYGSGQMLLAENALIVVGDEGFVALVGLDPAQYQELARFRVFDDKTWNTPALAGDQLFLRNQAEIACLKLPLR